MLRPHEILRRQLLEDLTHVRRTFEEVGWPTELEVQAADAAADTAEAVVLRVYVPSAMTTAALRARAQSERTIKEGILTADPTSLNPEDQHTHGRRPEQLDDQTYHPPTP